MSIHPPIQDLPFLPPPLGQQPNFETPESRGPTIIALCSACLTLMWPLFLLRVYSKVWVTRSFGWDDVSSVLAVIGATSYAAAVIWCMNTIGPHGWNVRVTEYTDQYIRITLAVILIIYGPTIFFAKLTLFLLYLRIFSCNRATRFAIYSGIVVNFGFYVATTIYTGYACVPRPDTTWSATVLSGQSVASLYYAQSGFGIAFDLYIFILPFPPILKLQLPLRKKLGICAIFMAGTIAIASSILGLYYRFLNTGSDYTWNTPQVLGLAVVEVCLGVICGSVPYIPAVVRHHKSKFARVTSLLHLLHHRSRGRSRENPNVRLNELERVDSKCSVPQEMRVEETVLGSINGEGSFLHSRNFSRPWWEYPSDTRPSSMNHHEMPV